MTSSRLERLKATIAPYVVALSIAVFAFGLFLSTLVLFGADSPRVVANGIVATSLFVFLLTLLVLRQTDKKEFLEKGAVRTAIAISFTVAYLMLLSYSLVASQLGLNYQNGFFENFYIVYISIIAFYFGGGTAEKITEIIKGKK